MRLRAALIAGFAALALAAPAQADTWTVTNGSSDATTSCNATAHTCVSLRAAIAASESTKDVADVINVPAGTININNDLAAFSDMTINGVSARTNIVDGGAKYRGLRVGAGATVNLNHFSIRNGAGGGGGFAQGGGVLNQGITTLDNVRVTGSGDGGVANLSGGRIAITHSLIDTNTGTGVLNIGGAEVTPITFVGISDSTIFDNTGATGAPGGLANTNRGLTSILRTTIADNTGGLRSLVGGITQEVTGSIQVAGSILARNVNPSGATTNCAPTLRPTDGGYNVEDNDTCGFTLTADPRLDTKLSNAGGDVDVLVLASSSPAIDRLVVSATNCTAGTLDQRGFYRPQGSACDSGAYEFDQPATYTITGGPSGTISSDSAQIDFSSSDPTATPECQLTGPGQAGGYTACYKSNAALYTNLANGTFTFSVRDADFPSSTPATRTFTVAALDSTITGGPAGPTNDTTPTFTFTGANGAVSFQCRVDTASFAACSSPFTTAALAPGAHTFEVRALSASGAPENTPASRSFTVDTTAPDTSITGGPTGTVASTSATFTFSSTEAGSTFQCALDGAAFSSCPVGYTGLAQGSHTFQVRAVDAAGNPDTTPASRTWTVDTVAPDTNITGGPTGSVASTSATFTFSSTEAGSTFQCALDGAAFSSCPVGYTGLAQGSHTFQVRATDAVGNTDATPASRTWTVDTVAPDTSITGGPTGSVASTSATFTFGSTEAGSTFECALDGAAFSSCPVGYTGLSQGSHTFQVRAIDAAGNTDATPASRTWTVDTVAPDTSITGGPTGSVASTSATFTFSSTEAGSTFQCVLDGAAFATCPTGYTGLAQGSHTFQVRAIDAAGNIDGSPASRTWTVDTVAPDTNITGGPSGTVASTSATFTFGSTEAGSTFQCALDGAAFATCPVGYTGLAQGSHTFQVRAIDAAGNTDASPASRTWTVDTVAPDTTITGGPTGSVASTTAAFTFSSTEAGSTFQCQLDGGGFAACPVSYTGLAQGSHTFDVRATDAVGNTDATPASRTWTVDTIAPDTTLTPITTPTNDNTPTFAFTATEAGSSFQCRVDGAAFATCTTPFTSTALADGSHTFDVRAVDGAGNTDPTPASQSFRVDTAAPDTTLTPISSPTNNKTPGFTFTSTESGSTFQCRVDGAAFAACIPGSATAPLADGSHTFDVRAIDPAGNVDPTPASQTFTVDATAPNTTLTPIASPTNDTTPTFSFSSTEAGSTFECRVDTAAFTSCTSPLTTDALLQGNHTFNVRAIDAAGNIDPTPASQTFTVDTTAPDTTLTPIVTPTNDSTPTFTFSSEAGATFQCRVDGAAFATCTSAFTTAALNDGSHTFDVRAVDAAGNVDPTPASQTFTVDATAPNTTITVGADNPGNDNTPTFTFTSTEPGSSFQCRVDGATYTNCTSPFTTGVLSDGSHTFDVRAIDAVGNVDATPATQTFVVDTTTPNTDITAGPTATNDTTPTFSFSGSGGSASFQCRVDGAAYAACTSPFTTGVLSVGTHTFDVRALNAAGTPDPSPASRTFVVDLTAPNTTLTPIASPTVDTTPTFSFSSDEAGSTFQCRVDGAAFTACTSAFTTAALSQGGHTFDVRAIDAAGNIDATPASQTFTVDTTAPDTTLTPIASPTNDTTPTFAFSSEAGATFECSLDNAAFTACASPVTTSALVAGSHTFDVRAIDAAGNVDASPATQTFVLDTTPPPAPEVSGPSGPTTDPSPQFGFAAVDAAKTECRLDGPAGAVGSFGACVSPKAFSGLAPGDYVFFVRSTDAAGNTQLTQRAFTVTVVQQATPTPTPTPTVAPTGTQPPVANQSVEAKPVTGTVLVKQPGAKTFVPLSPSLIRNGAEVDARNGTVEITRSDGGVAKFYDGIFKLSHSGGYTVLTLTEKLTGCPKAKKSDATIAAKKPKSRKLWGDGKGKFRTKGQYSAATVRGTKWLVQDSCTTTLTRVAQGVVEVQDYVKRIKKIIRAPKSYTARAKKK
ncbi:Ig-like domain-containing protein [Solirubrobacter soli]|uniref:Ig-like domain-containing protein n=1 Tax=Solirubrobacter soli TaxID=363832 RepID=UPI00042006A7|nr:Ig-like domain-containing protein [Solirubrobacter soli]